MTTPSKNPATALTAPPVTADQLALIKHTVAQGATADELKLYLYDCQRQGVHPLDRLVHFTKRGGRYTPITSIDLMRTRAHDTGECAGIDDPHFPDGHAVATVTVWRLVHGQRSGFSATARWTEYCPPSGQDHMWTRMPHTMLGKCAEALALRKAFPRQLSGLYAREELDQAGPEPAYRVEPVDHGTGDVGTDRLPPPPAGAVYLTSVTKNATKNTRVFRYAIGLSDGRVAYTINEPLATVCEQRCQHKVPVVVDLEGSNFGLQLKGVASAGHGDEPAAQEPEASPMLTDSDRAF